VLAAGGLVFARRRRAPGRQLTAAGHGPGVNSGE
jgi:hypothetical protein